jgi:hypothetical protein
MLRIFGSWSVKCFKFANVQAHSARSDSPGRALNPSLPSVGCSNINFFVDFLNLSSCAADLTLICAFHFNLPHFSTQKSYVSLRLEQRGSCVYFFRFREGNQC